MHPYSNQCFSCSQGHGCCCSLCQLSEGEGGVTPWASCQITAGPQRETIPGIPGHTWREQASCTQKRPRASNLQPCCCEAKVQTAAPPCQRRSTSESLSLHRTRSQTCTGTNPDSSISKHFTSKLTRPLNSSELPARETLQRCDPNLTVSSLFTHSICLVLNLNLILCSIHAVLHIISNDNNNDALYL